MYIGVYICVYLERERDISNRGELDMHLSSLCEDFSYVCHIAENVTR